MPGISPKRLRTPTGVPSTNARRFEIIPPPQKVWFIIQYVGICAPSLSSCFGRLHPHCHLAPRLGGQSDLPVDPRGHAPSVALRHVPHADQRVGAAPQHQLLQVPDPGPVLLLRRLEDPLPQPPYLPLMLPPVDLVPFSGCISFPGPAVRSVRLRGHRSLGHGGTDPGAAIPYRGGEAVTRHASNLPFGSSGSDRITSKTPLPTSAPFRVRAAARYPAGYAGRSAEGRPCVPVSRRLTARRRSLLGHPGPARGLGLRDRKS